MRLPVTGRCYCGACRIEASAAPLVVAYCHCTDCRRWTGAPVTAFAGFDPGALHHAARQTASGPVNRWNCGSCGSPIAATFDYLPGRVWVPVGILDHPEEWPPAMHSHADSAVPWLHIDDDLPRNPGSSRGDLNG